MTDVEEQVSTTQDHPSSPLTKRTTTTNRRLGFETHIAEEIAIDRGEKNKIPEELITGSSTSSSRSSVVLKKTRKESLVSNVQFASASWCLFILGWNDGTAGPLLPRMQEVYQVGYTIVSLIFVLSCIGFILGALLNVWLSDRFGFGKVLVFGSTLQIVAYSVQAAAPPFPAFIVLNIFNGIGLALLDSQANGFVGSLKEHAEVKMALLHAAYGLGGFAAPLVATQFAGMDRWSFHYLVSLGLAVSNAIFLAAVFRFRTIDECLADGGERVLAVDEEQQEGKLRQIMTNKAVHLISFFLLIYVGVEVTIGGWIVTYIIEVRGGGPSSGYVASGFFGGLTVGRVILIPINRLVGEHRVVYIYATLALALEFVIWFVPSLVGNAITVSIIGVLLGPLYPLAMNISARILPRHILVGALGWVAGFGQAGGALLPFVTGAIAQSHGIKSLHPFLVAMMGTMIVLFWFIPSEPPAAAQEKVDLAIPLPLEPPI